MKPCSLLASAKASACPMAAKTAHAALASARNSQAKSRTAPTSPKALSDNELAAGYVLTCCASAGSDVVLESRQVTDESAYPIKKLTVASVR